MINQESNIIVLKSVDAYYLVRYFVGSCFLGKPIAVCLSNDNLSLKSHFNVASQRIQYTEFYSLIEPLLCEDIKGLGSP